MIPKYPAKRASRRRWILVYPLVNLAILIGVHGQSTPWIEVGIVAGLFVLYVVSEFVLMPKMSLPPSRWCARCDARSPEESHECVGCGREFGVDKPVLYSIDTSLLPATKRAGWIALAIVVVMILPVVAAWVANPRGGQTVLMTVYFFMMIYGYEFAKWVCLRRIIRQVDQHSGAVCTHCVYPIDESMTVCPECGARETAKEAQRDWLTTGLWLPRERVLPVGAGAVESRGS